jgi:hypothetical protein
MRLYGRDLRFECLKLAVTLVNAKHVGVTKLLEKADELVAYVDGEPDDEKEVEAGEGHGAVRPMGARPGFRAY